MSTKFLRKTARRLIRDFDQFQDVYPQLIRSSDPLNNGIDTNTQFADDRSIVFSTNNTSFPAMVPVGLTTLPSSSISATVAITPSSVEQRPPLPGGSESLKPFNESLFYLPATYENTASIALAPGFNIPVRNKIGIPIDITSQQEKFLFRLGYTDTNADSGGLFYGQASTGFCYYNFDLKRWEDIGLTQNYVGHMGNATAIPLSSYYTFEGQNYFMSQFVGTPNEIVQQTLGYKPNDIAIGYGYNKIGYPTEFFDAPFAPRYHATSSQGLLLSNYIAQPFELERIDVKLPFVARRKHGNQLGGSTDPFESSLRDVDNLVFFLYRQVGNVDDALSTQRFLISHESLTFYNSQINADANYLTHNPVFSYDHNLSVSGSQESLFTGSIAFSMYPKSTSVNFSGFTSLSAFDTATSLFKKTSTLNYWTGPLQSGISSSLNSVNGVIGTGINKFWRKRNFNAFGDLVFETELDPDNRFFTNYATGSLTPFVSNTSTALVQGNSSLTSQYKTPYLLFPTDRILFGLEADICTKMRSNGVYVDGCDKSPLSVTSSFFKILTDSAQVTLYGSLVQNGVAKTTNSINPNLVSPAVHEIIANTQDDTDQFDIAEKQLFVGTYIDNFITGTMTAGDRGVAQSIIDGPIISSGSFIRCLALSDSQKTYYQNGPSTISIGPPPWTQKFNLLYSDPKNPKNYFRLDKYGNFRDMLEQARDYRIFNNVIYKKNGGFEDQGPVYANFVLSSSDIPVSASLTQCNNLSPYITGTFPFVDDIDTSTSRGPYTTTQNNPFIPITNIFKT